MNIGAGHLIAGAVLGLAGGLGLGLALESLIGGVALGVCIGAAVVLTFADMDR